MYPGSKLVPESTVRTLEAIGVDSAADGDGVITSSEAANPSDANTATNRKYVIRS